MGIDGEWSGSLELDRFLEDHGLHSGRPAVVHSFDVIAKTRPPPQERSTAPLQKQEGQSYFCLHATGST